MDKKNYKTFFLFCFLLACTKLSAIENNNSLRLINYNIQVFPDYLDIGVPPNNKALRIEEIPKLIDNQIDIVFFNEIFDSAKRKRLRELMKEHYPYYSDVANRDLNVLSSGVVANSRWPIEKREEVKYKHCSGVECLASKGVLYVKINKLGRPYHFFSTHLQSDSDKNSFQTREYQLETLKKFINKQNISFNEPIILAGDFNIDSAERILKKFRNANSPMYEYDFTRDFLNVLSFEHYGLKYSFDYYLNKMTAQNSSNRGIRLAIDHVWLLKNAAVNNLVYASQSYQEFKSNHPNMQDAPDTSDHFPVLAELVFAN